MTHNDAYNELNWLNIGEYVPFDKFLILIDNFVIDKKIINLLGKYPFIVEDNKIEHKKCLDFLDKYCVYFKD